jgi:hypothetical protein
MAEFKKRIANGGEIILPIGEPHTLTLLPKLQAHFIEIPDFHFNHASPMACLDSGEGLIRGIVQAYFHAQEHPEEELFILGHADTSGEPSVNLPLSEDRAKAVKCLLTGDANAWEALSKKAKVEDYQLTLKSLADLYFWDCDPVWVDGENGALTQRAVKGFQKEVNSIFGLKLAVDGVIGPSTWKAILFVLRELLARSGMDLDHSWKFGLGGDGVYACGESFPVDRAENPDLVSRENRRVELYFCEAGKLEPMIPSGPSGILTSDECVIFDLEECEVIPFGTKGSFSFLHLDEEGAPIAGASAQLLRASGAPVEPGKITDAKGRVFWTDLEPGEYRIEFS